MTTAHKPTWNSALGAKNQGGWDTAGAVSHQFSVRDMPQQMTLKKRKIGQGSQSELQNSTVSDLKAKLEQKESAHYAKKIAIEKGGAAAAAAAEAAEHGGQPLALTDTDIKAIEDKYDDSDEFDSSSSDSDSEDDEAEQAALMAELARIKKERAEEARRVAKEKAENEAAEKEQSMLHGNPLLQSQSGTGGVLKKKWNDDVVFKNQARDAPTLKKRYINDTVRNDFHRKFMARYIQ